MKNFYILSILVIFLINSVFSNKIENNDEGFYMIYIRDPSEENHNKKRQEISDNVEATINEIHNLIVGNFNTYKNVTVLEEMEEESNLRKRDDSENTEIDYGESPFIYPIANVNDKTILYSYLTGDLVDTIREFPDVLGFEKDFVYQAEAHYSYNRVLKHTGWSDLLVRKETPFHLSSISQGEYSSKFVEEYDTSYYYPVTAGTDVDVFIFDQDFNFNHPNFSNTNREARCLLSVDKSKVTEINSKICGNKDSSVNHGSKVAAVIAGTTDGVAKKANIYGINFKEFTAANEVAALQYIKKKYLRANKAIFNFSYGGYKYSSQVEGEYSSEQEIINSLAQVGAVFVASAGNDGTLVNDVKNDLYHLPSQFNNVISVGGVNSETSSNIQYIYRAKLSNYGNGIDIFAPFDFSIAYRTMDDKTNMRSNPSGTSYSSAIVSGVAALFMGENIGKTFNTSIMLKNYLQKYGQENRVQNITYDTPGLFVNNGKLIVYSMNGVYNGCGIHAGESKCSDNKCCSILGYCQKYGTSSCKIDNGCQTLYGTCTK
ncbi:subtilisin-like protein [Piromyces finnis]|uniref:Subtilisin-like protein n=1 Tax=Piromyces finnis TaxID=1754191 RepID=A0A1Y1VCD5_9FUNG|nr:subtilisin-like protein [Piromyces finnis]|eukprot:ORX52632.1 subtilisin-like protein [Piromyces finnis]